MTPAIVLNVDYSGSLWCSGQNTCADPEGGGGGGGGGGKGCPDPLPEKSQNIKRVF